MEFLSGERGDESQLLGADFRTCGRLRCSCSPLLIGPINIQKLSLGFLSLFFPRLDCWLREPGSSGLVSSHCVCVCVGGGRTKGAVAQGC